VQIALGLLRLAVRKLQRWYRWRVERGRLLAHLGALRAEAHGAATLLQRRWRGLAARRRHGPELQRRRLARTRRKSGPQQAKLSSKRSALYASSRGSLRGAAKLHSSTHGKLERSLSAVMGPPTRQEWRVGGNVQAVRTDSGRLPWPLPRANSTLDASLALPPALASSRAGAGGGGAHMDSQLLLAMLLSRGVLSASPRAPPWPQERPGLSDLEAVQKWLQGAAPTVEVRTVLRVEISTATAVAYNGVRRTLGPERLLWHGTPWEAVGNIVQNGFNRAYVGRHGTKLGRGTYFAEDPCYALRFCGRGPSRAIFLAGVLPGRYCRGEEGLVEPPPADAETGARFDATVDDAEQPRIFCVFRDYQALPLYLVEVG